MSSAIWTQCAGSEQIGPLTGRPWRTVEAQHRKSLLSLVDDPTEHDRLEAIVDRAKPPRLVGPRYDRLHWLLHTPFRYRPDPHASRFATRAQRNLWYGSQQVQTSFAEKVYHTYRVLVRSEGALFPHTNQWTAFRVPIRTSQGVDLSRPPFDAHAQLIRDPASYAHAQSLGRAMREAGVQAFRFPSARDAKHRLNYGLFSPDVFATTSPQLQQTWDVNITSTRAIVAREFSETFVFEFDQFLVDGQLPSPT
jgi:hypothetical protein